MPSCHNAAALNDGRTLPLSSRCEATSTHDKSEEKEGKEWEGYAERSANRHPPCAHSRADPQVSDRGAVQRGLPRRSHHGAPTQVEPLWFGALLARRHPRATAVARPGSRTHATRRSSRPSAGSGCEPGGFLSEVQRILQRFFHGALHTLHRGGGAQGSEAVLSRGCSSPEELLRCGDHRWLAPGQDRPSVEDTLVGESRSLAWLLAGGLRHLPWNRYAAVVRRRCSKFGARACHDGSRVPWTGDLGHGRSTLLDRQVLSPAQRTRVFRRVQEEQISLVQEDTPAASSPSERGSHRGPAGEGRSRRRRNRASAYTAEGRGQDLRGVYERLGPGAFDCRGH